MKKEATVKRRLAAAALATVTAVTLVFPAGTNALQAQAESTNIAGEATYRIGFSNESSGIENMNKSENRSMIVNDASYGSVLKLGAPKKRTGYKGRTDRQSVQRENGSG